MSLCALCSMVSDRLANLIHLAKLNKEEAWNVIKRIKFDPHYYLNHNCDCGLTLNILSVVNAAEKELLIDSSEQRYKNMTSEELETAAKMFIFLRSHHSGPEKNWFDSWFFLWLFCFYTKV